MMRKHKGYPVYPLTVAQKFHLFYLPYCPSAAVMNIGTRLTIQSEIDWDLPVSYTHLTLPTKLEV